MFDDVVAVRDRLAVHQRSRGTRSASEELARTAGTSNGSAKDAMETSERLPGQPELAKAIRRGELSPAQAGPISAAAAADPSAEQRLTELAGQVSLAELREECARVRAAADPDPEATNRRLHAGRRLRRWTDAEGIWNLHANGTRQAGALFNTVLDPIIDRIFNTARAQGRREHPTPTPSTPSTTWPNTPPGTAPATTPPSPPSQPAMWVATERTRPEPPGPTRTRPMPPGMTTLGPTPLKPPGLMPPVPTQRPTYRPPTRMLSRRPLQIRCARRALRRLRVIRGSSPPP